MMVECASGGRRLAHPGLQLDYGYMLPYGLFFGFAGFALREAARSRGWRC